MYEMRDVRVEVIIVVVKECDKSFNSRINLQVNVSFIIGFRNRDLGSECFLLILHLADSLWPYFARMESLGNKS